MNTVDRVAVCSRSFSKNEVLRQNLLSRYERVTFNENGLKLEGDSLVEFLKGHCKAIVALEEITDGILSQLPELKVISKYGVGVDMIDIDAMRRRGVCLGWTGGVNRRSVAEMVVSISVSMLRHFPTAQREVAAGNWRQITGGLLSGRIVGIVGCGFIGKDLATLLRPWGCKILVNDIVDFPEFYSENNIEAVSLEELLRRSDIVTLHIPLNESTHNILSGARLRMMKSSAILINAARGGLVDEDELKLMLQSNRLAAAACDVFNHEPPTDMELINLPNFFATPHIGGSAEESILAMGKAAIAGLNECKIP